MALPEQDLPQVAPTAPGPPQLDTNPTAVPAALSRLGATAEQAAGELNAIKIRERRMAAQLAATSAELDFGIKLDKTVDDFKGLGGLATVQQIGDYQKKITDLRQEGLAALKDPLAARQYEVRTRLQTQASLRHMENHANEQVDKWQTDTVNGDVGSAVKRVGALVTGSDVKGDLGAIATLANGPVNGLAEFLRYKGTPESEINVKVAAAEAQVMESALYGYLGKGSYAQGIELLNSKFPGTDTSVREIIGSKSAAGWEATFANNQTEKKSVDAGARWYYAGVSNPKAEAQKEIAAGTLSYAEAAKAEQQFTSLTGGEHTRHEIAIGGSMDALYTRVTRDYDGDLMKAMREDDSIRSAVVGLGVKRPALEALLTKGDKLDPMTSIGIGRLYDEAKTPGWTAKYGSYEAFVAQRGGDIGGANWKEAQEMYKHDAARDTSADSSRASFNLSTDTRARIIVGLRDHWDVANAEQMRARLDMLNRAEQAWVAHETLRKSTPNKEQDLNWANETLNQIASEVKKNFSKGVYDDENYALKVPSPVVPPAAQRVTTLPSHVSVPTKEEVKAALHGVSDVTVPNGPGGHPVIETEDQYDALPPGTRYYKAEKGKTPSGKPFQKVGG